MPQTVRSGLAGALLLGVVGLLCAQALPGDKPARHAPVKAPTAKQLDRQQALTLYGLGLLQEKGNRLVEAARTLEEARRLDPDAAAVHKALAPIYLALDRVQDALEACAAALALDPDDHDTGYLYARQLRGLGRNREAVEVLRRTLKCSGLKDRPDLRVQVWAGLAALTEQASDWAEAERCLRAVAEILEKPAPLIEAGGLTKEEVRDQAAETYERLGHVCLKARKPDQAAAAFREAQKKDPVRAARLAYNLAQVYEGQGKHAEALARLEEYLRTQPQGTEGYERKMALQRKLKRDADVLPDLEACAGRDPHNTDLQLLLAREYRKAGRRDDAGRVYAALLKKGPTPEAYAGLFALDKALARAGGEAALARLDDALAKADGDPKGKEKKPGDPAEAAKARAMLVVLRGDADLVKRMLEAARARLKAGRGLAYPTRGVLATLAARTKQLDAAEELYRSCLDELDARGADTEAEVYGGLLRVLKLRHKHAAVVALCKKGLEKAQLTNRVLFHVELARALVLLDDLKAALAAADDAVRDAGKPERLFAQLVRVDVLVQQKKFPEAVAACQELLKEYNHGGELREVRTALSNVHAAAGEHDQSEAQLKRILEADANDALACNNLGYHWADRNKNLAEAEKLIRKALELDRRQRATGTAAGADGDRDNAAYVDSLGWVLFRRGKLAEARKELERASALPGGDEDPVVWDHLGDVYFRLGERGRAAGAWKKAAALYEAGARRKADERYGEIRNKLKTAKP